MTTTMSGQGHASPHNEVMTYLVENPMKQQRKTGKVNELKALPSNNNNKAPKGVLVWWRNKLNFCPGSPLIARPQHTAHQTTSTPRLCWGDCVSINRIYVDADKALPEEERQPAQQKHAHDDAQGASRFVFGTPSLSRSHRAT